MKSEVRRAGLLLATTSIALLLAYQAPTDLYFDFGPNDSSYVTGFRADFEVDEPTLIHWSLRRGRVRLPVILPAGALELSFRYKRHAALPADIHVFVAGQQVDRFLAPQSDFLVRTVAVPGKARPWSPLEIMFLSQSSDPRPLGVALDWLRVRSSGVVIPEPVAFLYLLGTVLGLYAFPRLIGFSPRACLALGAVGAMTLALGTAFHKLAWLQASAQLGLRWHVLASMVVALFLWRRRHPDSAFAQPLAGWAMLAFYLGTTVRLLALFHPDFYYPDVRTHSKFVSIIWTEGLSGFFGDHIANQHRHLLGLQRVGEDWRAFPYPPLLYLFVYPLSLIRLPVEDWMKIVPTTLAGIEGLIVYVMALRLKASPRAAVAASWFHAGAPLLAFRLTVASYAALFGHFWDVLVALYLLYRFEQMGRARVGAGLALLVALSILSYAGSVLVLGLFVPTFAVAAGLHDRERATAGSAVRVSLWALAGALFAIGLFYTQYIPELLPGLVGDTSGVASAGTLIDLRFTPMAALKMSVHRLLLFYGPVFGPLVFAGLYFARRHLSHRLGFALACGAGFTFLGLNVLRSGLGATHIFQFSKDDLVLLPLAAIVLGNLIDVAANQKPWGRVLAAALLLGWMGWGGFALARDVRSRFIRPDYPPAASAKTLLLENRWKIAGRTDANVGRPVIPHDPIEQIEAFDGRVTANDAGPKRHVRVQVIIIEELVERALIDVNVKRGARALVVEL